MKWLPFITYSTEYMVNSRTYDLFRGIEKQDLRETFVPWKNNAFNLVAHMEETSPLTMLFRVHKSFYGGSIVKGFDAVTLKATFHEKGSFTEIHVKIKSNITYCIGALILAAAFIIAFFQGKLMWMFLIGILMFYTLDALAKYDLKKKFEQLLDRIQTRGNV